MLVVNALANILPFNGISTGAVSDSFNAVFVPAGYVFAIWGLIYIVLLGVTVYHSLPSKRNDPKMRSIGWWFALSNILNGAWIFFWHFGYNNLMFIGTLVIMLGLFATLMYIYLKLNIGKAKFSMTEKWLVAIPFSIYFGWISIATIANIVDILIFFNWNGFNIIWKESNITGGFWAIVLLAVGVVIAFLMMLFRRDTAYLLVFVWAFTGIAMKWLNKTDHKSVVISAFIAAGLIFLFAIFTLLPLKLQKSSNKKLIEKEVVKKPKKVK
jgi:hypothetical protein